MPKVINEKQFYEIKEGIAEKIMKQLLKELLKDLMEIKVKIIT